MLAFQHKCGSKNEPRVCMSLIKVFPPQKFFFLIGLLKNFLCRKHCYLFVDAANDCHLIAFLDHRGSIYTDCHLIAFLDHRGSIYTDCFYSILLQNNSVQMYQNLLFVNCLNWNLKLQNSGEYIYVCDMSKLLCWSKYIVVKV